MSADVNSTLWQRQGEDGRTAWNALAVGLARHGYDGKLRS